MVNPKKKNLTGVIAGALAVYVWVVVVVVTGGLLTIKHEHALDTRPA